MSIGNLVLLIAAILVFCGLLQRVLDRMYLTDRQALLLIGLMLVGTFLPDIMIGNCTLNIGGCFIPLGICIHLTGKADTNIERLRCVAGSFIAAVCVLLLSHVLPAEAEEMLTEPLWIYSLCAGSVAWVFGRSRRAAFVCGVAGTLLADFFTFLINIAKGYATQLNLGGGGIVDACVISGVLAVLICETIGEAIERIARRPWRKTP